MTNSKTNKIKKSVTAAIAFSVITGAAVGCVVTGYKYLCATAIGLSQTCYDAMRQKLWIVPIALVCAYLFSWILSVVYKRLPSAMGGGIPTSVAVLRGRIPFKWFANFISVFTLSIAGFVTGVPLGNEGPCVQMGTALGRGSVKLLGKAKSFGQIYYDGRRMCRICGCYRSPRFGDTVCDRGGASQDFAPSRNGVFCRRFGMYRDGKIAYAASWRKSESFSGIRRSYDGA